MSVAEQSAALLPTGLFRCPACHAPLPQLAPCACGFAPEDAAGVPLLVSDRAAVERAIAAAGTAGRGAWYEASQEAAAEGAWRHHLARRRAYLDALLAGIAARRGRARRALDLGCGDGVNLAWLKGHADEVHAGDYNLVRLARARHRGVARTVFLGEIGNIPVADDAFDLVFFNHVLEHIPDDRAALAEARRVLSPKGTLILGVPNEGALFWRLAYRLQPNTRRTTDHLHFYTAATIAAACRAAGFSIETLDHFGWGVPHWGLDERLRRFKAMDDLLNWLGRSTFPGQATSLYLALTK